MAGKFEIKQAENNKVMFNLKAGNGQVILTSQMYDSLDGCENGISSVKTNAVIAERYDRRTQANGEPYFVLLAGNGLIIGKSESYSSDAALENGIQSVTTTAPDAEVVNTVTSA